MNFPTATEVLFHKELDKIKKFMLSKSYLGFVDVNINNQKFIDYLKSKGFEVIEIRYEYKDSEYGFHGRLTGDGCIIQRIIWSDDVYISLNHHGYFIL